VANSHIEAEYSICIRKPISIHAKSGFGSLGGCEELSAI
jgi:hypothetical protein